MTAADGPDAATLNRAAGVLLGAAAGDALGAGYEFGPPMPPDAAVEMRGGGQFGWEPGEWTDDTAMAMVLADVASGDPGGADLRTDAALDRVVARWAAWARTAKDVGAQTQAVLNAAGTAALGEGLDTPAARHAREAAAAQHARTGRTAGNGSLMRTAPVALAFLGDPVALTEAATAQSALTHHDPEAGEACVLWCLAIRHAVLTGELDARHGLAGLPAQSRDRWARRLAAAEAAGPETFEHNGWVVHALQAAWSAVIRTPVPAYDPERHLPDALRAAVRAGNDTDTVAAVAGALLGACHGAAAVPGGWVEVLHGWPGRRAPELVTRARGLAEGAWTQDPDEELFRLPD